MVETGLAHHHIHLRKRITKHQPYPHKNFWIQWLDRVTIAAGVAGPAMVLPQVVDIYVTQVAVGVSVLTWASLSFLKIPFIVYGLVHRERLIVITYSLFLCTNALVAFGAFLYG